MELERLQVCVKYPYEPLSEKTRPKKFSDIIGQESGITLMQLCGPNRNMLHTSGRENLCRQISVGGSKKCSFFKYNARFVEMDATNCFDERSTDP